jgi:hypothetical protein
MGTPTRVDDLCERIRAGDADALLDPAFELHLLADGPRADWWREGAEKCAKKLVGLLIWRLRTQPGPVVALRERERQRSRSQVEYALRLRPLVNELPDDMAEALDKLERYAPR